MNTRTVSYIASDELYSLKVILIRDGLEAASISASIKDGYVVTSFD